MDVWRLNGVYLCNQGLRKKLDRICRSFLKEMKMENLWREVIIKVREEINKIKIKNKENINI